MSKLRGQGGHILHDQVAKARRFTECKTGRRAGYEVSEQVVYRTWTMASEVCRRGVARHGDESTVEVTRHAVMLTKG